MKVVTQDFKERKSGWKGVSTVPSAFEGPPLYVLQQKDGQDALH